MRLVQISDSEVYIGLTPGECQHLAQALMLYEHPLTDEHLTWWQSAVISLLKIAAHVANTHLDKSIPQTLTF